MWTDIIKGAQALLLVGECNFSFTISLLEITKNPLKITSTCLETDEEEQPRKTNIEFLREKGVRILLGIDATKLQEYQSLNNKYDCIIFNFPHVGGKSRIHRNRELLCSFFSSASFFLDEQEKSRIIITLCQGQGGVPCELPRRQRAYGDTWKVVEMAAYGSLVLERIEHFQANIFHKYVPSGYGKDGRRGFHVDDSITYIFCKSRPHRIGLPLGNHPFQPETLHGLMTPDSIDTHFGPINCSRVHASLYHNTPMSSSPISYALEQLIQASNVQQVINADKKAPLYICDDIVAKSSCEKCNVFSSNPKKRIRLAKCNVNGNAAYLRDSLIYSLQHLSLPSSVVLVKGHVFHELHNTFSLPPVGTEAMFTGKGSMTIILHILTKLAGGPGCCILRVMNENALHSEQHLECIFSYLAFEIISLDQMLVLGHLFCGLPNVQEACTVNLDNVALMIFSASDWRELRTKACRLSLINDCTLQQDANQHAKSGLSIHSGILRPEKQIKLIPESLYPPTFIFDVCFSENGVYSETEFWYLLWHLVGDVVISVELLDCYHPPPERIAQGHRTSWCYRLKYRSYEFPLHRKAAVRIQNEVLHWGLVNILGVNVK